MHQLYRLVVRKRELYIKATFSVFRSVLVSILTYGHECWIINERMRFRVQAAEMFFSQKIRGLSLLDKVKSTDIRRSPNIKPLLLRIERSQLRWYGHVTRMSHEWTAKQLMDALPSGKKLRGRPRTRSQNYVEDLARLRFGIPPAESPLVAGDRDARRSQLEVLLLQPQKNKWARGNTLN